MQFNKAFFDELLVSAPVAKLVDDGAQKVANVARATAPVDSGDYKRGIRVGSKRQKRVVGLVQATDEKSMIIEARTGNLVRALRSVGRGRGA